MNKNFSGLLAEIAVSDGNLELQNAQQEEILANIPCNERIFGKWIDDFGLSFLEEFFSLSDEDFQEDFPEMNLTTDERDFLRSGIILHANLCPHCKLKIEYDTELDETLQQQLKRKINRSHIAGHA